MLLLLVFLLLTLYYFSSFLTAIHLSNLMMVLDHVESHLLLQRNKKFVCKHFYLFFCYNYESVVFHVWFTGYSCRLLIPSMNVIVLNEDSPQVWLHFLSLKSAY